jgi:hypothetical protein
MKTETKISLFIISLCVVTCLFLASCKKITPGSYAQNEPKPEDTTTWEWKYTYKGTLPNWGGSTNNELVGTRWVLTKVVTAFATSYPNDTIEFVSNNQYKCNFYALRTYTLTAGVASTNKTLTLNYFLPFGGSHYSGEVGQYFVSDGQINNAEFKNIQNSTATVRAWFLKL